MFAQSLTISRATPVKLSTSEVSNLTNSKNLVIYTGAGISSPSAPDTAELIARLAIPTSRTDKSTHIVKFIRRILKELSKVIEITINDFKDAFLYNDPTPAHYVVKDIALLRNWQLLTENLDLLHQRSGVMPLNRSNFTS